MEHYKKLNKSTRAIGGILRLVWVRHDFGLEGSLSACKLIRERGKGSLKGHLSKQTVPPFYFVQTRPVVVLMSFLLCLFLLLLVNQAHVLGQTSLEEIAVIEEKEGIVKTIAEAAADAFRKRSFSIPGCPCSQHSCGFNFTGTQCHNNLGGLSLCGNTCDGQMIDFGSSIVRTPPGTEIDSLSDSLKESICTYTRLDELFVSLGKNVSAWTYIGTTDGHFRRWPATGRTHNENGDPFLFGCSPYDPRVRPWYIAASTGPKDIVFVIDKSGSMLDSKPDRPLKWNITVDAVLAMIDTLGPNDYFNIVAFSDSAEELWTENRLVQGKGENKEAVKTLLINQAPNGGTNFERAFNRTFDLLINACDPERKTCSGCEKVIIFLTDGKDTSGMPSKGIKPSEMGAKIASYQERLEKMTNKRASIFTFSMGLDADDSIPRQIACNNDGAWAFIRDTDDPLTAMRSYYLFLTARRRSGSPVWTEPYEDASGLGFVTTVAMPIFLQGTEDVGGVFLGVAGQDVLLSDLGRTDVQQNVTLDDLVARGEKCDPFITDGCQLQVLRNAYAKGATCVDRFPINPVVPNEKDEPECFTNGKSFYKRFSSLVNWEVAQNRCEEDGGALVSIGSDEELNFAASMASDDGTWIGAKRDSDAFTWLDRSSPDLQLDSDYWGIAQPDSYNGVEDCVSIDTRGPTGNLNDARCDDLMTFICEYTTDKQCTGKIRNPITDETKAFYEIPPVELCVNAEEALAKAEPIEVASELNVSDILCPFGDPVPDTEILCCPDCNAIIEEREMIEGVSGKNTTEIRLVTPTSDPTRNSSPGDEGDGSDEGVSGELVAVIAIVSATVVILFCGVGCFVAKRKSNANQERQDETQQKDPPSTVNSVPTRSQLHSDRRTETTFTSESSSEAFSEQSDEDSLGV